MCDFSNILADLSLTELKSLQSQLENQLKSTIRNHMHACKDKNASDFVSTPEPFITCGSKEHSDLLAEVDSLDMINDSGHGTSRWLTCTNMPYEWSRANGLKTVKKPIPISNFPNINKLLALLNSKYNVNMNSCLISCLSNGTDSLRLHSEDAMRTPLSKVNQS